MTTEAAPDVYSLAEELQAARMARAQMDRAAETARMLQAGQFRPEPYPALRRAIRYAIADGMRCRTGVTP